MCACADDAIRTLQAGAPGRIRRTTPYSEGDNIRKAPLAWLRENGRYLTPTGIGDTFYAAALILRNWLSLHAVIGILLTAMLAGVVLLRTYGVGQSIAYGEWEKALLEQAICQKGVLGSIWWSPLTILCLIPLLTFGVWVGLAYWMVMQKESGESETWLNTAFLGFFVVGIGCLAVAKTHLDVKQGFWLVWDWPWKAILSGSDNDAARIRRWLPLIATGFTFAAACICYLIAYVASGDSASRQRQALTRGGANALVASLAVAALGAIDTLGQSLYLLSFDSRPQATLSPAGLAAALVWMARKIAQNNRGSLPDWVPRLPLQIIAGMAGVLIFFLVGGLWSMFVHWLTWGGQYPNGASLLARQASTSRCCMGSSVRPCCWLFSMAFIQASSICRACSSSMRHA
ncbi:MAG: hypothetical protein QM742_06575 [Aquabacterium sp.]